MMVRQSSNLSLRRCAFSHDDEECARHGEELPTFTSVKDEECDQHNGEELLVPTKNEEWEEAREEEAAD